MEVVKFEKPDADAVIAALEELLAQAKAGAVSGLAYAVTRPDGNIATNVCWEAGNAAPLLLAGTSLLHQRVIDDLLAAHPAG